MTTVTSDSPGVGALERSRRAVRVLGVVCPCSGLIVLAWIGGQWPPLAVPWTVFLVEVMRRTLFVVADRAHLEGDVLVLEAPLRRYVVAVDDLLAIVPGWWLTWWHTGRSQLRVFVGSRRDPLRVLPGPGLDAVLESLAAKRPDLSFLPTSVGSADSSS